MRDPGVLQRAWQGPGLGGMFLSTLAGAFIGSAIAQQFFADDAAASEGDQAGEADQTADGGEGADGADGGGDFGGDSGGDFGGGDFGGGDFGGF